MIAPVMTFKWTEVNQLTTTCSCCNVISRLSAAGNLYGFDKILACVEREKTFQTVVFPSSAPFQFLRHKTTTGDHASQRKEKGQGRQTTPVPCQWHW